MTDHPMAVQNPAENGCRLRLNHGARQRCMFTRETTAIPPPTPSSSQAVFHSQRAPFL
jgi:hypothetical protein